jgi:hypothetical protein
MIIAMIAAAILQRVGTRVQDFRIFAESSVLAGPIFRNPILQALWKTAHYGRRLSVASIRLPAAGWA